MVDLKDWEKSGEGWNAVTYNHKADGSLLLKLNSEATPYEESVREYRFSRSVHDLGVSCPEVFSMASDGTRFGYIAERLSGKKSFARILSDSPEMLEPLARDMAEAARALHSLQCDTAVFESVPERIRKEFNSCGWIKEEMKELLNSYADGMRPVTTCLHGDMHPGNYVRTDKGDCWIDFGRFGYGDPDMDYASQFILANLSPAPMVKWILHIDRKTYIRFLELFGRYYYGEDFHSSETQERLGRAICLTLGHGMAKYPAAAKVFGPYVDGHEWVSLMLMKLIGPIESIKIARKS